MVDGSMGQGCRSPIGTIDYCKLFYPLYNNAVLFHRNRILHVNSRQVDFVLHVYLFEIIT